MKTLPILLALTLSSCSTTLYEAGKPVARIQSDAGNLAYSRTPDGAVTLTVESLSNSAPVLAVGRALAPAVAAWTAAQMMKDAPNTINAFTGNHPKP